MSQSPRFSSWTLIVQRHPQGRYLLQSQHCQEDKNQVKNQLKNGPILRHPDAQEIGQFRDQIRCSPSLFPLFSNSTQTKHRNTQARESRGNAPDHLEPRPKPNRWEISARTPGPMQNSEHPWTNQQAKLHQDVPKQLTQKCILSSRANPASIWSSQSCRPPAGEFTRTRKTSPRKGSPTSPRVQRPPGHHFG